MNTEKTSLRKKLEELEDDVHKSWLKDLDKVKEIGELTEILRQILDRDTIESYFENDSDFDYFIKKFSHEVISNILRQYNVYGVNGDDVAFQMLLTYVRIFLKFFEKPAYLPLWESVKEIFDPMKSFYKSVQYANNRNLNEKKLITADKYNVSFFTFTFNKIYKLFIRVLLTCLGNPPKEEEHWSRTCRRR
jgi:hypothetical protein